MARRRGGEQRRAEEGGEEGGRKTGEGPKGEMHGRRHRGGEEGRNTAGGGGGQTENCIIDRNGGAKGTACIRKGNAFRCSTPEKIWRLRSVCVTGWFF